MKKIFFLLYSIVLVAGTAAAQETTTIQPVPTPLTSKRGIPILPEYSDLALGISANPFLNYMGRILNGTNGNTPVLFDYAANPANNIAIFGKYMVDENTAYRVRFNVNIATNINKAVVGQNQLTPDPLAPAFTEDWQKNNVKNFVIAGGLEKRRGVSRVQGVYGGELVFALSKTNTEYQYGNPITLDFNAPITHSFTGSSNIVTGTTAAASVRVVEENRGTNFLIGARGFIGVEYFFAPKMSLGGEFGYMFAFRTDSKTVVTTERWDSNSQSVRQISTDTYSGSGNQGLTSIGVGLDNLSGSINLLFYF